MSTRRGEAVEHDSVVARAAASTEDAATRCQRHQQDTAELLNTIGAQFPGFSPLAPGPEYEDNEMQRELDQLPADDTRNN